MENRKRKLMMIQFFLPAVFGLTRKNPILLEQIIAVENEADKKFTTFQQKKREKFCYW